MMSRFTGAADSSHKIEIDSKERATQWHSECCIYKVPKRLRKVKEEAYTPKLISIGPIHRGNPELMDMEILKHSYCEKFFHQNETKKTKKEFESIIVDKVEKIRNCYAKEITLRCGEDFVNMILLDSIFIIELFWMTFMRDKNRKERDKNRNERDENINDYILSKPWLEEGIKRDLRLLENQLPLFILNDLYSQGGDKECFITLACNFFDLDHEGLYKTEGVKHFTDLHRNFYRPPHSEIRDRFRHSYQHLHSATELQNTAGLMFQKYEEKPRRGLLDIQLNSSSLTHCFKSFPSFKSLVVPQFVVEDGTEEFFRNLMALEQCHYPFEAYICSYIVLLDFLISSKEDVELLVDKRIIVNLLGSGEEVADMVNKLCLEIVEINSCYRHIADGLNNLYDSHWNQNMASLRNVYFRDIWRGTATVAGILALFFAFWSFLRPLVSLP